MPSPALLRTIGIASCLLVGMATAEAQPGSQPPTPAPVTQPAPTQPQPYPTQPQPYSTQPQPYSTQPQPYSTQPQPYSTQPQPYSTQPQPYSTQPQPYSTQPQPYPAPQPQFAYGMPTNYHLLSFEEQEILNAGEINQFQIIGGGAIAWTLGFGTGHLVQGRWSETGWKFTLGEAAAIGGILVGISMSLDHDSRYPDETRDEVLIASIMGLLVVRVWGTIDAFVGPSEHNRKYRAVRWKAYGAAPPRYGLYLAPPSGGGEGGLAGLRAQF